MAQPLPDFDLATAAATAAASSAGHALLLLEATSTIIRAALRSSSKCDEAPQSSIAAVLLSRGYEDLHEQTLQRQLRPLQPPPSGSSFSAASAPAAASAKVLREVAAARASVRQARAASSDSASAAASAQAFSIARSLSRSIKTEGDWPFDWDPSLYLPQAVWTQHGARLTGMSIKRDALATLLQALRRLTGLLGPRTIAGVAAETLVIELKVATQQIAKAGMELGPVLEHLRLKEPQPLPAGSAASAASAILSPTSGPNAASAPTSEGAAPAPSTGQSKLLGRLGAGFSRLAVSVQQAANTAYVQAKAELNGGVMPMGEGGDDATPVSSSAAATTADGAASSSSSLLFSASSPAAATSSLSSSELIAYASLVSRVCDEVVEIGRWVDAAMDGVALKRALESACAATSDGGGDIDISGVEERLVLPYLTCGETRLVYHHCKTAAAQWSAIPTEAGIAVRRITAFVSGYVLPLFLHDASVLLSLYLERNASAGSSGGGGGGGGGGAGADGSSWLFRKLPSQLQ